MAFQPSILSVIAAGRAFVMPSITARIEACAICVSGAASISQFTYVAADGSNTFLTPEISPASNGVVFSVAHWLENTTSTEETVGFEASFTERSATISAAPGGDGIRLAVASASGAAGVPVSDSILRVNDTGPIASQRGQAAIFTAPGGSFEASTSHDDSIFAASRSLTLPPSTSGDLLLVITMTREVRPIVDDRGFVRAQGTWFYDDASGITQYLTVYSKISESGDSGRSVIIRTFPGPAGGGGGIDVGSLQFTYLDELDGPENVSITGGGGDLELTNNG